MMSTTGNKSKRGRVQRRAGRAELKVKNHHADSQPVRPEVSGRELRELLYPITPETFLAEYWSRKPLFIKGQPGKLARLIPGGFGREDFYRGVRQAAAKNAKGYNLFAGKHQGHPLEPGECPRPFPSIEPDQMEAMFASGANVGVENPYDQRLAAFSAAVKTQLHHPGEIRLFATLSPTGQGFPPHVDRSSGIFIQCEGTKRYVISSAPIFPWPRGSASLSGDGTGEYFDHEAEEWETIEGVDMNGFIEVVMEPGDVLIIPPGTVHGTEAVGGHCLNLNLLFLHYNFLDLIGRVLEDRLISNPLWRHLPAVDAAQVKPGMLPAGVAKFFAARLAELRDAVNALDPMAFDLNRQWHKSVANPGEVTLSRLPSAPTMPRRRTVQRTDVLRLSRNAPMTCAVGADDEGDACFYLYFGNREVSVAGEWVPFLKTMFKKRRFLAASAAEWAGNGKPYVWKDVQAYLQALLEQGFLERETVGDEKRP